MEIKLRPYQEQALEKAIKLKKGFMNNESMGKGKTITTIYTANRLIKDRNYHSVVIVCPANVIKVWEDNKKHFNTDDITIYSYNKIALNYILFDCDILILDESHKLKNPTSKTAKKLRVSSWKYCFCLTGTPMEKAYMDIWSQLRFIDEDALGDYKHFVNRYCIQNVFKAITGYRNVNELLSVLNKYMFISKIEEDKSYTVYKKLVNYRISEYNQDLINKLLKNLELEIPEYIFITTRATKQRIVQHIASGKYGENKNLIDKLSLIIKKHKNVIVLYNFNCERDIIKKHFPDSLEYSSKNKQLNEYLVSKGVLVAQISSIGEGTDGLQNVANCIVFVSLNWSYRLNIQSQKRIDRIGQNNDCYIYYMKNNTEIDDLVLDAIKQKRSLSIKTLQKIKED